MTKSHVIIVINAGSSSIKFSVFGEEEDPVLVFKGQIDGLHAGHTHFQAYDADGVLVGEQRWAGDEVSHADGMRQILDFLRSHQGGLNVVAVGHRVVHGGPDYTGPVRLDAEVVRRLDALTPLAPLHQPHNLAPIRMVLEMAPDLPQVACFDTSFHTAQPALAQAFALPPDITCRGVRRYGFHGLSYEYVMSALPQLDLKLAGAKVVIAHLGNGASMCAVGAGKSVASTMGFTAVEGLPMGTRSGSLDPGVILYLLDEMKMDARAIERLLYKQSGLLGVSGISSDMRSLEASSDPSAKLAIDLFVYRIGRELGSLAAALGGIDALVFTAGIGENSALIRRRACATAGWLGLELDETANEAGGPRISSRESRVSAWVVRTNEELMIARHTRRLLSAA